MLATLVQSKKAFPECLHNSPVGYVIIDAEDIFSNSSIPQVQVKYYAEADALKQIQGKLLTS